VTTAIILGLIFLVFLVVVRTARVVPQKTVFIVERLGKYHATLEAGFHILIPFIDRVAYKHSMKEMVVDVPPQSCITKDSKL
jgi:regulator of protease activity HflC (stomatin/prohibitin superfamily)